MQTSQPTPLLGGLTPAQFMRRHWQKRPLLVRGAVRDTGAVILAGSFASAVLADDFGRNDLQAVAEARCREVRKVAKWLHSQFGNSRMTGSGSAVFARVGTHERSSAAWPVRAAPGTWIARMCRSLDHHPLRDWAD